MSLWDDFYNNFEIEKLAIFIEYYNNWVNNCDIYLHRVLENIFLWNWTNLNSPSIKNLLTKIRNKHKLTQNDIKWLYEILNLENETIVNSFEYTKMLIEIDKKSKK
jgi:hypothetical protein